MKILQSATCLIVLVATAMPALGQPDMRQEQVQFQKGHNGAIAKGSIKGRQIVDYHLRAAAGQTMDVTLKASKTSAYFNILPPGEETALFIGSTSGTHFSGKLPKDGDYIVRVYRLGKAESSKQAATYELVFKISD